MRSKIELEAFDFGVFLVTLLVFLLGLKIEAIRELIELSAHPNRPCADADRIAAEQLQAVRDKINRLRRLERELARIAAGCEGEQIKDCYVFRALASHDLCDDEH